MAGKRKGDVQSLLVSLVFFSGSLFFSRTRRPSTLASVVLRLRFADFFGRTWRPLLGYSSTAIAPTTCWSGCWACFWRITLLRSASPKLSRVRTHLIIRCSTAIIIWLNPPRWVIIIEPYVWTFAVVTTIGEIFVVVIRWICVALNTIGLVVDIFCFGCVVHWIIIIP